MFESSIFRALHAVWEEISSPINAFSTDLQGIDGHGMAAQKSGRGLRRSGWFTHRRVVR
jgi:hypothetical protein